jgi:hypothetical protein
MQKLNAGHGQTKMVKIVSRRLTLAVIGKVCCLDGDSFVVRC